MKNCDLGEFANKLENEFMGKDLSNLKNPLYDLSDGRIKSLYDALQKETGSSVIYRDTSSWGEITEAVKQHISKYGDGALILIEGASPHIFGALPRLKDENGTRYVSATALKLNLDSLKQEDTTIRNEQEALKVLGTQMRRDLGVVKYLGKRNIEDFLSDMKNIENPKNIILGFEETGEHSLYCGEAKKPLYDTLLNVIQESGIKPKSILYIEEDLNVDHMKKKYARGDLLHERLPRGKLFAWAKKYDVPVEFGAFGIRDRLYNNIHYPSVSAADIEEKIREVKAIMKLKNIHYQSVTTADIEEKIEELKAIIAREKMASENDSSLKSAGKHNKKSFDIGGE